MRIEIPGTTLTRDTGSKALLQTDKSMVDDYRMKRTLLDARKQTEADIAILKTEMSGMKNDLEEIKTLLRGLVK